jgi:lipopolysaccharide transport system permease protein
MGDRELQYSGAAPSWRFADLRELWRFRELLLVFALRELKVRYRQAIIGAAWAVLQPLAMLAVFSLFFGLLGRRPSSAQAPYMLSAFSGLIVWQFVSGAVRDGAASLVSHRDLLTKTYFPRLLLPTSHVVSGLVDLSIAAVVLAGLMSWWGEAPKWTLLFAPLFLLLAALTALAAAVWLSALNALYRDVGHTVPFLLQIGFFASPVVYETQSLIPREWWWAYGLNPMVSAIEGVRWAALGTTPPSAATLAASLAAMTTLLISGLWHFRRVERWIADRI